MNIENITWNKDSYRQFIEFLYTLSDIKYKDFHSKLILDKNLIGIRTPLLKDIAKKISKTNYLEFIKLNNHAFYEETIIHGLLIGYIKEGIDNSLKLLDEFSRYINNWAICDLIISNLKIVNKNKDKVLHLIHKYLKSDQTYQVRVALVLLLDYYITDNYIDIVLDLSDKIETDEYYIKMANAWLISICYIKYKDKTKEFLLKTKIDKWTYNKAIQKIIESKRTCSEEKELLRLMKK